MHFVPPRWFVAAVAMVAALGSPGVACGDAVTQSNVNASGGRVVSNGRCRELFASPLGYAVARGERLEDSLNVLPGRRAAHQTVLRDALRELEGRAILTTVDVHGHLSRLARAYRRAFLLLDGLR
jgi:hypothetical protein